MRRRRFPPIARIAIILVLIVLAGFPIYWMYDTAITPRDQLFTGQPLIPDVTRTPQIFDVFTSGVPLLQWLANSSIVAFCTTFLSLLLAVLAGYGLSRYRFHGRGVVGFILFATQMLPEALLIVPLYALFAGLGLLNGLVGLVLADTAFVMPVAVWIVKSAMDSIPYEIEEAARVDGCPRFVILLRIICRCRRPRSRQPPSSCSSTRGTNTSSPRRSSRIGTSGPRPSGSRPSSGSSSPRSRPSSRRPSCSRSRRSCSSCSFSVISSAASRPGQ